MKFSTLGQLKQEKGIPSSFRSVKEELRENLINKLHRKEEIFPGIIGYEDSVIPGLLNAIMSKHNLILLGLRGQGKSRILRALTALLDDELACVAGCEINDDPFFPICASCVKKIQKEGDDLPIVYLPKEKRYVEKLATPDVTIADIIGDLDPIKAAKHGRDLSEHENIHFGLLPRGHRGIFAINELPDLSPKIQVGLFNVMQEGDIQIKGFPVRLPLDIFLVFSANPEDYTARGKIITPLKDRIGSQITTHYPHTLQAGIAITRQESWVNRNPSESLSIPDFIWEIVENIAFKGRHDKRVDKRSGVSQRLPIACLENTLSNAERRTLATEDQKIVPRISDIYASMPAITGKLELEYEGELKGSEFIARELIESAILATFEKYFPDNTFYQIIQWFDLGGEIKVDDQISSSQYFDTVKSIQGLEGILNEQNIQPENDLELAVSMIEFILEGLSGQKRLSRNASRGYFSEAEQTKQEYRETIPPPKST